MPRRENRRTAGADEGGAPVRDARAETVGMIDHANGDCGVKATCVANFCRVTLDGSGHGKQLV
jgi:hypothetical protein